MRSIIGVNWTMTKTAKSEHVFSALDDPIINN